MRLRTYTLLSIVPIAAEIEFASGFAGVLAGVLLRLQRNEPHNQASVVCSRYAPNT